MSDQPPFEFDKERYFNDPEYRKAIRDRKRASEGGDEASGGDRGSTGGSKHATREPDRASEKRGRASGQRGRASKGHGRPTEQRGTSTGDRRKEGKHPTEENDRTTGGRNTPSGDSRKGGNRSAGGRSINIPRTILYTLLGFTLILLIAIGGYLIYLFQGLPPIEKLENPRTATASVVLSRDGATLDRYFIENRTAVGIEDISPHVINALVATEDHRFYTHWGMDMVRTLAIPFHILRGDPQGGSTISQQLARNLYIEIGQKFSITRKFREMITAVQIENNYTKREIIEMYLNTVEFSNSAFGIEAAAQIHYGKPARDLTVSEAATMIGTLQAVSFHNPRHNPDNARRRRNVVLYQMVQRGFLDAAVFEQLRNEPIVLNYHPPSRSGRESRYFGEYVRQRALEWTTENGYDLYADGLTIHTTIDSRLQRHAERAVREKVDSLQTIFEEREWGSADGEYMGRFWRTYPDILTSFLKETDRYRELIAERGIGAEEEVMQTLMMDEAFVDSVKRVRTRLEAGFTGIDPSNGHVLFWVGGTDYGVRQYDHVYQSRRQTGSTFKPFVYAVAIDNGYMPYHTFSKYPISFIESNGKQWRPSDMSVPAGPEMIPLRQGLARSLNNITVRLLPEIAGAPETNRVEDLLPAARMIRDMAANLGIDMSREPVVPSIALGTTQASLLELVSAYTTFANQGVHIEPLAITRIEDKDGNVLVEYHPDLREEVISPETAYIMLDMMRGVINGGDWGWGTGVRLRNVYNVTQDVAGKTGTTQNSADNWFIAMMPHVVMGAWVGGEDRRVRFPNSNGIGQGARSALPIVGQFINYAESDPDGFWSYGYFEPPPGFVMPEDPGRRNEVIDERRGRIGW